MDNVMFGKLNRSKVINDNFTLEESKKIADAMDSMMSVIFQAHNRDFNTTASALKLLKDPENKTDLYKDIYDRFERLRIAYVSDLEADDELLTDPKFFEELVLLDKITANFGNLTDSLEGKEKNNVIAYHLEKSRYRVLRDEYIEIEDPSNIEKSNLFKLNTKRSKAEYESFSSDVVRSLTFLRALPSLSIIPNLNASLFSKGVTNILSTLNAIRLSRVLDIYIFLKASTTLKSNDISDSSSVILPMYIKNGFNCSQSSFSIL
jgi:hypothetical protein